MKKLFSLVLVLVLLTGCTAVPSGQAGTEWSDATHVTFVDGEVTVKGDASAITTEIPIVYYEEGHDFTYGEGDPLETHSAEEAGLHTVVTITKPGTYVLSGKLRGQVAVDLGEGAEDDPKAVVTLVLSGVDITCTVAPGVIFYHVYECGSKENPKGKVDTSAAGANVVLDEGSENIVRGSHVARIYKPGSVVLSEDGTKVEDSKKLHKYDGAFYSKMSMNLSGEGSLTIHGDHEGLDTELHLTMNGGNVDIFSDNDGINTNEDGISVTTINDGSLTVTVTGSEGDGIDSNGWLVVNGGTVRAWASSHSQDSGLDADMGIVLQGGTVFASGNMLDRMEGNFAVFSFAEPRKSAAFVLKNEAGVEVLSVEPANSFRHLLVSAQVLIPGAYTLWSEGTQFEGSAGQSSGFAPGPVQRPDWPDKGRPDVEIPPQPTQPVVTHSEGTQPPAPPAGEMPTLPEGQEPPEGQRPPKGDFETPSFVTGQRSAAFPIEKGANYFSNVTEAIPVAGEA